nr:hypothetical protein [uncultured Anaerostipes sp.]
MKQLYGVNDIMKITGMSQTYSYKIIRTLNTELEKKGFLVIPGRVNARYFAERIGIKETADILEGRQNNE